MKEQWNDENCKKEVWQNELDPGPGILPIPKTKGTGSASACFNIREEISDGQFTGKRYWRKTEKLMMCRTVNDIKTEIIEKVMAFYCYGNIGINLELEIGRLTGIIEIVAFVFEEYLLEFNNIVRRRTGMSLTEEGLLTEKQLIISWISLETLNELRRLKTTIVGKL